MRQKKIKISREKERVKLSFMNTDCKNVEKDSGIVKTLREILHFYPVQNMLNPKYSRKFQC